MPPPLSIGEAVGGRQGAVAMAAAGAGESESIRPIGKSTNPAGGAEMRAPPLAAWLAGRGCPCLGEGPGWVCTRERRKERACV